MTQEKPFLYTLHLSGKDSQDLHFNRLRGPPSGHTWCMGNAHGHHRPESRESADLRVHQNPSRPDHGRDQQDPDPLSGADRTAPGLKLSHYHVMRPGCGTGCRQGGCHSDIHPTGSHRPANIGRPTGEGRRSQPRAMAVRPGRCRARPGGHRVGLWERCQPAHRWNQGWLPRCVLRHRTAVPPTLPGLHVPLGRFLSLGIPPPKKK